MTDDAPDWCERITAIGESVPEVDASGDRHVTFRVRKKTFAYHLVDQHGDGRIALACRAAPGGQRELVDAEPHRFFVPAYVGARGWVGLDLDAAEIDWSELASIMKEAYLLAAPKTLARQVT